MFSRTAGREGRCRQISLVCVGSTHSAPATLGLPCSQVCAFPISTEQAAGCSIWSGPCVACSSSFWIFHKSVDSIGPAFCAFPCPSSSGSQELDRRTLPGCGAPSPLRGPGLFPLTPVRYVRLVSFLGSWPLATTLPVDIDHTEPQEVFG